MKNRIYDAVAVIPVNRVAVRVTDKRFQYQYKPNKKSNQRHWETPPLMRRRIPWNMPKLVGTKFGMLTVIGLYEEANHVWVVRCVCGRYETRRTKAIRNPRNNSDRCEECRHLEFLKKNDEFLRTGRNSRDFCT